MIRKLLSQPQIEQKQIPMGTEYTSLKLSSVCLLALFLFALPTSLRGQVGAEFTVRPKPAAQAEDKKEAEQPSADQTVLIWKNGNQLPGELVKSNDSNIFWDSELFGSSLEVGLSALNNIGFPYNEKARETNERFFIQTLEGNKLFGNIEKVVAEKGLFLNSKRHGNVVVGLDTIANIVDMENAGYILLGISDLGDWSTLSRSKRAWEIAKTGELKATNNNIDLYRELELPDAVQIELTVRWEKTFDFAFGFGVPSSQKNVESLVVLETWDNSLVLNQPDDFSIIYEDLEKELPVKNELTLLIHWDRAGRKIVIRDGLGKELCSTTVPKDARGISPGLYLANRKGDFQLEMLRVSKSVSGVDPVKQAIQLTNGSTEFGEVVSYDGTNWKVKSPENEEIKTVAATDFRKAILSFDFAKEATDYNTQLRFQDGELITGNVIEIKDKAITIQPKFSSEPVVCPLVGLASMDFSKASDEELKGVHRLESKYGQLIGTVVAGTGKIGDVIRWKPVGCLAGVPLTNANAKIYLGLNDKFDVKDESDWPDTMYFRNRDTIPCRIMSIEGKEITFESFAENATVNSDLVKAIDFSSSTFSGSVSSHDGGWQFSDAAQRNVEITGDNEMIIGGAGRFGHETLASKGSLKFNLQWKRGTFFTLELRGSVRTPLTTSGGVGCSIMMWDNNVSVTALNQRNIGGRRTQIPVTDSSAEIEIVQNDTEFIVLVNGEKRYTTPIQRASVRGNALAMEVHNMNNRIPTEVVLSNVSVKLRGGSNRTSGASLVSAEKLDKLLTIPRLRKNNPPQHILCARNGDFLRGGLEKLDGNEIQFESRRNDFNFERKLVSSIVWLHAQTPEQLEELAEEDSAEKETADGETQNGTVDIESGDQEDQTVQVIMKGGRRITLNARKCSDTTIDGLSDALGRCSIPIEEILELRFGAAATEATDVAYAEWVAKHAIQPKLEDQSEDGGSAFGKGSPLVGTVAKDFTMKMLDGPDFKLSDHRGKVVVLDFWATWCKPCVNAMPDMIAATSKFDSSDVTFIAVNQLEDTGLVQKFLDAKGYDFSVGMDKGPVGEIFDVSAIPQTVIIDATGKISFVKIGGSADLESKITDAINEAMGAASQAASEE